MKKIMYMALMLLTAANSIAQDEKGIKTYPPNTKAGAVTLLSSRFSSDGNQSVKSFTILSPATAAYELKTITALLKNTQLNILLDNKSTGVAIKATEDGWQKLSAAKNGATQQLIIPAGKHEISFTAKGSMIPMVDDIYFQAQPGKTGFDNKWEQVKQMIDKAAAKAYQPEVKDKDNNTANIALPNPEGVYDNQVDMPFAYTTFAIIYLSAGTTTTLATSSSTVDPVLMLFNAVSMDSYSWSNDDDGPGYESLLTVTVPVSGNYYLVARPYGNGQSGTTTILKDGVTLIANTALGGIVINNTSRTGELNYFTCRHTGDTRIFTAAAMASAFNGYNDDYSTSGSWGWGTASRIKKNYTGSVTTTFVCAYSLGTTGTCDMYMGNPNSDVYSTNYSEFPLLKADDAIKTAPGTGQYNCTSWAGGVTSTWIWPPQWSSQYCCNPDNTKLDCFDNFYGNYPISRFPGAWNYTRTGATAENSVVDLWKYGATYTHASVRKPGNGNPHGYDWESKPGGLTRTLHPRNALEGPGYGVVGNYYKATGTYASLTAGDKAYNSDEEAIQAGVAVVENAQLTAKATGKLNRLTTNIDKRTTARFNELYEAWKKTWQANAIYSDPDMYCRNAEFEALAAYCNSNYKTIYLVFDKYIQGDDLIGKIVWDNTRKQYGKLLDEAKADYQQNPLDEQGRFKIHGDHDNGVHYIEKILKTIEEDILTTTTADDIRVTVSPNPVKDIVTVKLELKEKQQVSVQLLSVLSGRSVWMQAAKEFTAGEYRFTTNVSTWGISNGDMLAVKVKAGTQEKTIKVLVIK